jgi:hypothetical protein
VVVAVKRVSDQSQGACHAHPIFQNKNPCDNAVASSMITAAVQSARTNVLPAAAEQNIGNTFREYNKHLIHIMQVDRCVPPKKLKPLKLNSF